MDGSRIICAVDVPGAREARVLAGQLRGRVAMLKIGLELFVAEGPGFVRELIEGGHDLFLDLKLHDIPNTVGRAAVCAAGLGVRFLTIHAAGSRAMIQAATDAVRGSRTDILAVTVLTSLDEGDLRAIGVDADPLDQVLRLARLAKEEGAHGIVCSPLELRAVRAEFPTGLTLVTPGIRPADVGSHDQKRTMTPADAIEAGADYLVVGRAITGAPDPGAAADALAKQI